MRLHCGQGEHEVKIFLLAAALSGSLYHNSAFARDQDGILIFGGGTFGCARNPIFQDRHIEFHVKCSFTNSVIIDAKRQTVTTCGGYIEGNWIRREGEILLKNNNLDNGNFKCQRSPNSAALDFEKLATYDVSSHSYRNNPTPMLLTYDPATGYVQVCVVPFYDMEMACVQERAASER